MSLDTGSLFILVGMILLVLGVIQFFRQREYIRSAIRTEGDVIGLIPHKEHGEFIRVKTAQGVKLEQKYTYRVVVRFKPLRGRQVKFTPGMSMRPPPYQVGDRVPVLYPPEHPHRAQIDRFLFLWFLVIMLNLFGLLSIGMGVLLRVLQ
jgi:hypothetical protein